MPPHLDALFSPVWRNLHAQTWTYHRRSTDRSRPRDKKRSSADREEWRKEAVGREGRKKEISEGDRERFISSSKGLDSWTLSIAPLRRNGIKYLPVLQPCFACETVCTFCKRNKITKFNFVLFTLLRVFICTFVREIMTLRCVTRRCQNDLSFFAT